MPPYEITLFTRPLIKGDLVNVLHKCISLILDQGAVVTSIQSLGHRDLPTRLSLKQTKEHVFATNSFLVNCHMSISSMNNTMNMLFNELDLMRFGIINSNNKEPVPDECNLEELLKPPAYRKAIEDLRVKQKLGHFPRQRLFKRTEKEWRAIPKSYTIAPPRF